MIYLVFFVCPFLIQIFLEDTATVAYLNDVCLASTVFFLFLEGIQLKQKGLASYQEDLWNFIDLA
jgi:hypothetical protein